MNALIERAKSLNAEIGRLNQEKIRIEGRVAEATRSFDTLAADYLAKYGVQLTLETVDAEYDRVAQELAQRVETLERLLQQAKEPVAPAQVEPVAPVMPATPVAPVAPVAPAQPGVLGGQPLPIQPMASPTPVFPGAPVMPEPQAAGLTGFAPVPPAQPEMTVPAGMPGFGVSAPTAPVQPVMPAQPEVATGNPWEGLGAIPNFNAGALGFGQ